MCVHVRVYVCACVCAHVCVYVCVCMCVCMCVCVCVGVDVFVYSSVGVFAGACMCASALPKSNSTYGKINAFF